MPMEKPFDVVQLASLKSTWAFHVPSRYFRLFVAADVTGTATSVIAEFARAALTNGMVYFCAWGPDCERFHDTIDEIVVTDAISERLFSGSSEQDTIMTTWHENETLDDALDFFVGSTHPTSGFEASSDYWLAISVADSSWTATIKEYLEERFK